MAVYEKDNIFIISDDIKKKDNQDEFKNDIIMITNTKKKIKNKDKEVKQIEIK